MEIYKLSDNIGEKMPRSGEAASGANGVGELKITGMRQGVKNENRVNVYVNDKYALSLDIAQVVELGVKVGRVLEPEELEELKRASEFGKLYQRTLEWVLTRPRSEKETRDYLRKKIYEKKLDTKYIDVIVARLEEKKYLDDYKYAEYYVENRFVKKGVSKRRMQMELAQKGVKKEVIELVLKQTDRNDADEIRKIIAKKGARYDEVKLIQYLCRQGFDYELSRELVSERD